MAAIIAERIKPNSKPQQQCRAESARPMEIRLPRRHGVFDVLTAGSSNSIAQAALGCTSRHRRARPRLLARTMDEMFNKLWPQHLRNGEPLIIRRKSFGGRQPPWRLAAGCISLIPAPLSRKSNRPWR